MRLWLAIACGGAVGAVGRFWCSNLVYQWLGRDFPWGTLVVNLGGSLLMGLGYVWLIERSVLGPEWRMALLVGVLGAFTTFSTFSIETVHLLAAGAWWRATANVLASVLACVGAAALGMLLARQW